MRAPADKSPEPYQISQLKRKITLGNAVIYYVCMHTEQDHQLTYFLYKINVQSSTKNGFGITKPPLFSVLL